MKRLLAMLMCLLMCLTALAEPLPHDMPEGGEVDLDAALLRQWEEYSWTGR